MVLALEWRIKKRRRNRHRFDVYFATISIGSVPQYVYQDSKLLAPAIIFWRIDLKLAYGPFGQSNMQNTLDFCLRPARKETNVPLHKKTKSLLSWYTFCVICTYSWHLILSHFTLTQDYVGGLDNGRRHWAYLYLPLLAFASKEHQILIRKTFIMVPSLALK